MKCVYPRKWIVTDPRGRTMGHVKLPWSVPISDSEARACTSLATWDVSSQACDVIRLAVTNPSQGPVVELMFVSRSDFQWSSIDESLTASVPPFLFLYLSTTSKQTFGNDFSHSRYLHEHLARITLQLTETADLVDFGLLLYFSGL